MNDGFVRLTLCPSVLRNEIPTGEWCKLLAISSKLDCNEVRARAIHELTAKKDEVTLIDRIELGNRHNVPQWLPEAYADVFVRKDHLTIEEGKKLGLEVTVKILEGRDTCKRNSWGFSTTPGVTQLVKRIFPPSEPPAPLPLVQRRREAGRFVYRARSGGIL